MSNKTTITSVSVRRLQKPLIMPFRIATGAHQSLDNVLLTVTLACGIKGYGEAAVAPHITGETVPKTMHNLKLMASYLKGQDIGHYQAMGAYVNSILSNNRAAAAAVEMALYDALTKLLKIPLWSMWGGVPKSFVTDITLVVGSLEETTAMARSFYAKGFRCFKIKVGRDMDMDLKRVIESSRIIKDSQIILDANQGFDDKQTLTFLKKLRDHKVRVDVIEQPVPKEDWEGLKRVTRLSGVCVCADESVSSLPQAVKAIREKAVGAINIKLMKTGMQDGAAIARLAKPNGIKLMLGGMMESSLAMTASAHLAAGLGCFDFIDLDTPFFIKNGLKGHPCLNRQGRYDLRGIKAGIGINP